VGQQVEHGGVADAAEQQAPHGPLQYVHSGVGRDALAPARPNPTLPRPRHLATAVAAAACSRLARLPNETFTPGQCMDVGMWRM
jgi:hypothetical protein